MSAPTVSVVVSSYNYGRYIGATLAAVRDQTFADFEVVVVDDGSSDDSVAVVERFLDDRRFRLVRQGHRGLTPTKNHALAEARGSFLAFLDADDIWRPDKLERQLARFRAEPDLGVVFSRRGLIDADGRPLPCRDPAPPEGWVVGPLYRQNFVCFSSALVRAEVPARVGGFDERLGMAIDYDFWLRAARHYRFGVVDAPLVDYRVGHLNVSRRQYQRLHVALFIMRRFERHFDAPARLDAATLARSDAETFAHLGVIARGFSRRTALGWLVRAVRADPGNVAAWRGLAGAVVPTRLRRLLRRLLGRPDDWERLAHSRFNRPEAVL
jgi:glycosyltransferase involved in cell wall biosynthesis